MTPYLLQLLVDPKTGSSLELHEPSYDSSGNIITGALVARSGKVKYQIVRGVPRFLENAPVDTVSAFGDEWNFFNFVQFKENWLQHTVANTWGSPEFFYGKTIVDAGGGSGAQTKWFLEYGAQHVILLDLSHSVDDVVKKNLSGIDPSRYDIIQCSIDAPPLKSSSIDGIVYCHNVIQHTPSVEKTATALYSLVAPGGEFVFNCYGVNDLGLVRWVRLNLVYKPLRAVLKRVPFGVRLAYSRFVAILRLIPIVGTLLEKANFVVQGDVPVVPAESVLSRLRRRYKCAVLNTFDGYGAHAYQWLKTDDEIKAILESFKPKPSQILNYEKYFQRPAPIGCGLRVIR